MNDKTLEKNQLATLQKKLDSAINSRSALEEDFTAQTILLTQFINKLSLVSKGIDLELDNRLAQLRALFLKAAPLSDIENKITVISKLLQQHSLTNEKNISQMHQRFNFAGESLQKIKGLPNELRRNLRELLTGAKETKDALIQYIPLLDELLEMYILALNVTDNTKAIKDRNNQSHLKGFSKGTLSSSIEVEIEVDNTFLEKILCTLNALSLSQENANELLIIKKRLTANKSKDFVLSQFINIFDVIVAEFNYEKNNAKSFLTSLNRTLANVQLAVKETLEAQNSYQLANDKVNIALQKQLIEMTGTVESALSLDQVKIDINDKLQQIASTLDQKSKVESQNQLDLSNRIASMTEKMAQLEKQSREFEEKLAVQQRKSMQDALTQLANRASFDDYFSKAISQFNNEAFELALVVLDIDNFKQINDTYGHSAGDKTLQVIANTIKKHVNKDVFAGRYGGEEFVLIYSQISEEALINKLNKLNQYVARLPFKFKNDKVSITFSIGATHIRSGDNTHLAFERADKAMYTAKTQGKNQVIYTK